MAHKELVEAHILGMERLMDFARLGNETRYGRVKNVVSLDWLERTCAEEIARLRQQMMTDQRADARESENRVK